MTLNGESKVCDSGLGGGSSGGSGGSGGDDRSFPPSPVDPSLYEDDNEAETPL